MSMYAQAAATRGATIYSVECSFAEADTEAAWNAFYSHTKLPALIAVPGFRTSQRFRLLNTGAPTYLALHTIDHPDVLTSEAYRINGGGHFGRWQSAITDWRRTIYDSDASAPQIGDTARLLSSDEGPDALAALGLAPIALVATALDRMPPRRWLAVVNRRANPVPLPPGLRLYAPMTPQLTPDRTA